MSSDMPYEMKTLHSTGDEPLSIVDAHVHFWDTEKLSYSWLAECGPLNTPMLPSRLNEEIEHDYARVPFKIEGLVQVQADADPSETFDEIDMVQGFAHEYPLLGMVAYAPLEQGDAVIDTLQRLQSSDFVKGVRRSTQNETDDFILHSDYIDGLEALEEHGLSADICARGFQLPKVTEALSMLRTRGSDTRIILDHAGKPAIPDFPFEEWKSSIADLADIPEVYCKLSGLLAEVRNGEWSEDRVRPYLEVAIERFGEDRVLFSGDWPIVKFVNARYCDWVEIIYQTVRQISTSAVSKVFTENAMRIYRL